MTTLRDIADYLEAEGVGTYGTDIFIGSQPPSPDSCIVIYEYAGTAPDLQAGLEYPRIQIMVRNSSWVTAREKLEAIQEILQEVGNQYRTDSTADGVIINGTFYAAIRAAQGITSLGEDDNRRMRLTQNYLITKGRN